MVLIQLSQTKLSTKWVSREDRYKPASPISHTIAKNIGISHAMYERAKKNHNQG